MNNNHATNNASNITNYQAVNCSGKELGIVEGLVTASNQKGAFVVLSTHHKDLFGNITYAVPFDLCDIDHQNKTIWLNVEKNEMEFLYKIYDLYDKKNSYWDEEVDQYFNINPHTSSYHGGQNLSC